MDFGAVGKEKGGLEPKEVSSVCSVHTSCTFSFLCLPSCASTDRSQSSTAYVPCFLKLPVKEFFTFFYLQSSLLTPSSKGLRHESLGTQARRQMSKTLHGLPPSRWETVTRSSGSGLAPTPLGCVLPRRILRFSPKQTSGATLFPILPKGGFKYDPVKE